MTDVRAAIKKAKPDLKDVSVGRYVSNIEKLFRIMDESIEDGVDLKVLEDTERVMAALDGRADATKKTYLNAVVVLLRACDEKHPGIEFYSGKRDELNKAYFDAKATNTANDKEKAAMITFEEWDGLIADLDKEIKEKKLRSKKELSKADFTLMLAHLLVVLYRHFPMRNDFAMMKVVSPTKYRIDGNNTNNYYINGARTGKFILNDFKTARTYGQLSIGVDEAIARVIRGFLKVSPNKEYLVVGANGRPLTRNQLSKFLISTFQKYLGKAAGTQMLRKSYLSDKYGDELAERKKDAAVMGHSLETQQNIYTKTD